MSSAEQTLPSRLHVVIAAATCALLCHWTFRVAADTVTAGGSVARDVEVQTIRAGKVFYLDSAGALVQAPVEAVESIRFDGLTELDDAQRFMSRQQWAEALPKLLVAMSKAEGDAEELWLHAKLAETHGHLGDFIEAAGHAGAVLDADPHQVWLALVPAGELNEPTFYTTGEAGYFLKRARRNATDPAVVQAIEGLLAQIEPVAQEIAGQDARQYRPGSTISGILIREIAAPRAPREPGEGGGAPRNAVDQARDATASRLPTAGPESPASIDGLLEEGEFIAALAICQRVAENPGDRDLAQFLHQYGQALAGSARAADAAVRFMQCAIEFPATTYATWSIIETAIIYREHFDKPDTADRLLTLAITLADQQGNDAAAERARALLAGNGLPGEDDE